MNTTHQFMPIAITQDMILPGIIKGRHISIISAKGDIFYNRDGVNLVNLGIGKTGQVLTVSGGIPAWSYLLTTGIAANRPTSGNFAGQQYFATDTFALSIWTGSAWKSVTLS